VHRWSILRAPLLVPIAKVCSLVMCLCRLHNFCIDANEYKVDKSPLKDAVYQQKNTDFVTSKHTDVVMLDEVGRPASLLGGGHHFTDAPRNRRSKSVNSTDHAMPMDEMIKSVIEQCILRLTVRGR